MIIQQSNSKRVCLDRPSPRRASRSFGYDTLNLANNTSEKRMGSLLENALNHPDRMTKYLAREALNPQAKGYLQDENASQKRNFEIVAQMHQTSDERRIMKKKVLDVNPHYTLKIFSINARVHVYTITKKKTEFIRRITCMPDIAKRVPELN